MSSSADHPVTIDIQTATESPITEADVTRLRAEAGLTDETPEPRITPAGASSDVAYAEDEEGDDDLDRALEQRGRALEDTDAEAGVPDGAAREDEMPPDA